MILTFKNVITFPSRTLLDMWDRYSQVFTHVWAASAFKGATGPCQSATDIAYHVENHKGWLDIMLRERQKFKVFRGYVLTGWQRQELIFISPGFCH